MVTRTVDIQSERLTLEEVLAAVRKGGEIIFTEGNVPLARIIPFSSSQAKHIPGLHPGVIEISDDFDEPLLDKFWSGEDA